MTRPFDLTYTREARCAASGDDRTVEILDLTIGLTFDAVVGAALVEGGWELLSAWVDRYMVGHDLTFAFDFPPAVPNIAVYLAQVADAFAPGASSVTVSDGSRSATAYLHDDEPT